MQTFTIIFLAALLVTTFTQLWLAARHIRYIRAHRDSVPDEFATQIDLAAHQKAADYTCAKTRLSYLNILLYAILLLVLTLGGGLNALYTFWSGWLSDPMAHGTALIISTVLLISIIEIPLRYYRTFIIEQRFGFNKMTSGMFLTDLIKQFMLSLLLGIPLLFSILWLMEKTGEIWWFYAWLAWVAFSLLIIAIYPTWIAPLYNKFTPLEDTSLKTRIEQLLKKCGFKSSGLYVMDGSRRSSHGNAYFTGFGKSKRIVFFDTLLSRLSGEEIEAVLAHELGHFKCHHVIKRMVLSFVMSLIFLWILGSLMEQHWFYQGLGVSVSSVPSNAIALLLFFLVIPVFSFLLHPLGSLYSRKHEFEADEYATQHVPADNLVHALIKLYQDNASTLTPDPLHSVFYDSHPPAIIRVAQLQNIGHQ